MTITNLSHKTSVGKMNADGWQYDQWLEDYDLQQKINNFLTVEEHKK